MDQNSIRVILQGIERQIMDMERRLDELIQARTAFIKQHEDVLVKGGTSTKERNGAQRRLPRGMPRKWVLEVVSSNGPMTIAEMKDAILNKHGKRMADGTIRRVVESLKNENKFFYNESDGTFVLIEEAPPPPPLPPTSPSRRDDDDDLPF